jgi:hypothetical protein
MKEEGEMGTLEEQSKLEAMFADTTEEPSSVQRVRMQAKTQEIPSMGRQLSLGAGWLQAAVGILIALSIALAWPKSAQKETVPSPVTVEAAQGKVDQATDGLSAFDGDDEALAFDTYFDVGWDIADDDSFLGEDIEQEMNPRELNLLYERLLSQEG